MTEEKQVFLLSCSRLALSLSTDTARHSLPTENYAVMTHNSSILSPVCPHMVNVGGRLIDLSEPQVMGIVNLTPDSFHADSRVQTETEIAERTLQMQAEGAGMLDVGACSTRPGSHEISTEEEMARLRDGLTVVRREAPDMILSVDTYRADVARMCVEEFGVHIINDISGGKLDARMFRTVASLRVPYILTHLQGTPFSQEQEQPECDVLSHVFISLAERINCLRDMGVADIILDPGFGLGKTHRQNFALMRALPEFREFGLPLLVGVSRKRMVWQTLCSTPAEALNGTTVLHTMALMAGAHILRVHDVAPAMEAVRLVKALREA